MTLGYPSALGAKRAREKRSPPRGGREREEVFRVR